MHALGRWLPALALACGALGCGDEDARAASARASATEPASARERDPRLAPLVRALESGRAAEVLDGLRALDAEGGGDTVARAELEARALFLTGDSVGALRVVEESRREHPLDGRLWACEAELYAAMGRSNAAEDAWRKGLSAAGTTPELERAHGVVRLMTPGGARRALEALEHARELDPALFFVDVPLSQAHLLLGREALADAPQEALAHAQTGLRLSPGARQLVELEAEALDALGSFDEALDALDGLAGAPELDERRALLHKKAATAALLAKEHERSLEHFRAARELGLDDAELGFGATALASAADEEVVRGCAQLDAGEPEAAEATFERALHFDARSIEAQRFLGVARFRAGRYAEAAEVWEALLRRARAEHLALPEPVHLDLARAWKLAGEPDRARAALDDYLRAEPEGPYAAETREMLERLAE